MTIELKRSLSSSSLGVMTFLNEVAERFPQAISLAPGRPAEQFFDMAGAFGHVDRWVSHRSAQTGHSRSDVLASLGQYGNTAGLIQDLISQHLAVDLEISVSPDAILVTSGCQEAMLITLLGLMDPAVDTLLVSDPGYVGIVGAARLVGVPVYPVRTGTDGLDASQLEEAIHDVLRSGRRPRALYDGPDFNNPRGTCIPLAARRELLALADRHGIVILEDNAYGAFAYDHDALPTLKSLDSTGAVIYLGSFAKTLFPGLRIGYAVADQRVASGETLAATLAQVKSFTTVNTPPVTQAMVGGALLEHGGSLAPFIQGKLAHYRDNRDAMLAALAMHLGEHDDRTAAARWNRPAGGFFVVLEVPFAFGTEQLERCARDYGVIVCPMAFFAQALGWERHVRLSFSYGDERTIEEGIQRLSRFVRDGVQRSHEVAFATNPSSPQKR